MEVGGGRGWGGDAGSASGGRKSGFEAVERKGIFFGSMLEEESVRGAAEDEERTSVGKDECMEGGLEGSGQKHVCRREDCGDVWLVSRGRGMVCEGT